MKNYDYFIGIDISKYTLNLCIIKDDEIAEELLISNKVEDLKDTFKTLMNGNLPDNFLVCAENTGTYSFHICKVCDELGLTFWLEDAVKIKLHSGLRRGKNDKVDARTIAAFAQRFQDRVKPYRTPDTNIMTIKHLIAERDLYVSDFAKYKAQISDQKDFIDPKIIRGKLKRINALKDNLEKTIKRIDKEILRIVNKSNILQNQFQLLTSIEGVGEKLAVKVIAETNAFKNFTDARKFCCHAGVAPFSYTSGLNTPRKGRVSKRADKSIKKLLHMSALSLLRSNSPMGEYYKRKVNEGKSKMSVINALRAKLIYRMFAVIRNNTPYKKDYHPMIQ